MIKHVLVDLDDTILDFHASERVALRSMLEKMGIEMTEEIRATYSEINRLGWKKLERGEITREALLVERFAELFTVLGTQRDAREAKRIYESELSRSYFFIDGAEKLLDDISEKFSLYLASNGTDSVQTGRIAASGIEKYFKDIFISERIGYNKPAPEYFEECFKRIKDFKKEECIIVGDSISSDILGGKGAGIKTCLYNPHGKKEDGQAMADYEIRSLGELVDLLMSI